jgi:hypothetical protein
VALAAGLDCVEKRPGLEVRTLGRPVRSQSIYRLRYPRYSYVLVPRITEIFHLDLLFPNKLILLTDVLYVFLKVRSVVRMVPEL